LTGSSVSQFRDAHFESNSAEAGRARASRRTKNNRKVGKTKCAFANDFIIRQ